MGDAEIAKAQRAAVRYLGPRARSEHEVREHLSRKFAHDAIDAAVAFLVSIDCLDDAQFAKDWAAYKKQCGRGRRKVAFELERKGVAQEHIAAALDEVFAEVDVKLMRELIEKKRRTLKNGLSPFEERQRIRAYLASRGFTYEDIANALTDTE